MRPFQDLLVWQKAHDRTLDVYRLTRPYPSDERFGLTSQTRRAAASVPGNIPEGCGKRTLPQLRASLDIAGGFLSELEYWFTLGRDLGYMPPDIYQARNDQLNEVRRMLLGFTDWSSV